MNILHVRHNYIRTREWPFNSDSKIMAVEAHRKDTANTPGSSVLYVKGAIERILGRCTRYYQAGGAVFMLSDADRKRYMNEASRMGCAGLRGRHREL